MKPILLLMAFVLCSCGTKAVDAHLKAGRDLYFTRDFANAEYELTKSLAVKESAEARYLRGKCLFFSRRFPEAVSDFDALRRKAPDHVGALLWSVRARLAVGQVPDGMEGELRTLLSRDEENVAAAQVLGTLLEAKGDSLGAMAAYQKSLIYEKELSLTHRRIDRLRSQMGMSNRVTTSGVKP